jgi:hypothetical protein
VGDVEEGVESSAENIKHNETNDVDVNALR